MEKVFTVYLQAFFGSAGFSEIVAIYLPSFWIARGISIILLHPDLFLKSLYSYLKVNRRSKEKKEKHIENDRRGPRDTWTPFYASKHWYPIWALIFVFLFITTVPSRRLKSPK
jgi:hypothetical protein